MTLSKFMRGAGLAFACLAFSYCSGGGSGTSSSSGGSSSSDTVTLTGTAASPTATSSVNGLSRPGIRFLEDTPSANTECTCDNLSDSSADPIATDTTDADGNFAFEIDDTEAEAGDELLIDCGGVTTLVEYDGDSDGDGAHDCGEADLDTTLAWFDWIDRLQSAGCADFTTCDFDEFEDDMGVDVGCFDDLAESLWEDADIMGDGLAGSMGLIQYMNASCLMMDDCDTDTMELIDDLAEDDTGALPPETLTTICASVETYFDLPAETCVASYDSAVQAADAFDDMMAQYASSTPSATAALFRTAFQTEDFDFCSQSTEMFEATIDNWLDSDDVNSLTGMFSGDAMEAYFGFVGNNIDDWTTYNQDAFYGTWQANYLEFSSDGSVSADDWLNGLDDIYSLYSVGLDFTFESELDWQSFYGGTCGTYYDTIGSGGTWDPDAVANTWYNQVYYVDYVFDPDDWATTQWDVAYTAGSVYDYSGCDVDPTACDDYTMLGMEYLDDAGYLGYCGDEICEYAYEDECLTDCSGSSGSSESYSYSYCGDSVCDDGEAGWCIDDCGGGGDMCMSCVDTCVQAYGQYGYDVTACTEYCVAVSYCTP